MFILQDYITLWINTSLKDKIDICDTNTGLTAESHGFNSDVTKKALLNNFLSGFIDMNREDLINEIYVDVLKISTNTSYYDRVEELCYFNLNMQGEPYDNYWVYMLLNKLYTVYKIDLDKAVEICKKSFEEIDFYLPKLRLGQDLYRGGRSYDEVGSLPNYVFCRDTLIYNLIDANKFDEAEKYENIMIEKNLFPDKNGKERLKYNRLMRISYHITYLVKENLINEAINQCSLILKLDKDKASLGYKQVGNHYLKIKNNELAFHYFTIAIEINPAIEGLDKKITNLSKKINLNYIVDKEKIINDLKLKEKNCTDMYQLLIIANRYYSIKEYEKSIDLYNFLLSENIEWSSLTNGIIKAYKAIGKQNEQEKDYNKALEYYSLAYKLVDNSKNSTIALEKEKIKIGQIIIRLNVILNN